MAFPSGDWNLYANGFKLDLFIEDSTDQTTVNGTVTSGNQLSPILAGSTWNDALSEINFSFKVIETGEVQIYSGFLFDNGVPGLPLVPGGQTTSVMAGIFTADLTQGGSENPDKAKAGWGWFAYLIGPGPEF